MRSDQLLHLLDVPRQIFEANLSFVHVDKTCDILDSSTCVVRLRDIRQALIGNAIDHQLIDLLVIIISHDGELDWTTLGILDYLNWKYSRIDELLSLDFVKYGLAA